MTILQSAVQRRALRWPTLFQATVFLSAGLVFLLEPMVAKLVLPLLGGSPSVWSTCMAFFQVALLAGYGYAHALQRVESLRIQAMVHCAVLALAALALPLRVSGVLGEPSSDHPALWLLGVLMVSVGAPFAALSATAPLVQAWYARTAGRLTGQEPYPLYAASNLGSLIALLAYPVAVEPFVTLGGQRIGWSLGYVAFALLLGALSVTAAGRASRAVAVPVPAPAATPARWRDRIVWLALAAAPASLMLGVTTHLTTDVASAPFLWVVPLALYLVTFIIAFSERPLIRPDGALFLQAAAAAICTAILPFTTADIMVQFVAHLSAFFFTALVCHQALVARRPDPAQLTDFYLWMSIGGVVGGAFNAFLAPVVFSNVLEYPIVLVLAALARPWANRWGGSVTRMQWGVFAAVLGLAAVAPVVALQWGYSETGVVAMRVGLAATAFAVFLTRHHVLLFTGALAALLIAAEQVGDHINDGLHWRNFFGVISLTAQDDDALGGEVRVLAHGTTLHGAQAQAEEYRCQPMIYYTPNTPIGQVFGVMASRKPALDIATVGLGAGSVAAYVRSTDRMTFFEIDPRVVEVAREPEYLTYTAECAKGRIDYVIGDARLTLAKQPDGVFDLILLDAFSSDAVPAHLLTVEAMKGYLRKLSPEGVLVMHLSNRNLDLRSPAMAGAAAAGAHALLQRHDPTEAAIELWESPEDALVVGRTAAALAPFAADSRWTAIDPTAARPWTDDYTNLAGALYAQVRENWSGGTLPESAAP